MFAAGGLLLLARYWASCRQGDSLKMIRLRSGVLFSWLGIVAASAALAAGCGGGGNPSVRDSGLDTSHDQATPDVRSDSGPSPDGGSPADSASDGTASDTGADMTIAPADAGDAGAGDASDAGASDTSDAAADIGGDTFGDASDAADGATADTAGDETTADDASDAPMSDASDASEVQPIHGPLVAYWPLDEGSGTTTADKSGNGDDGSLLNGPTWSTSGFPGATFADPASLVFDGVNDFVSFGLRAIPANEAPKTVSLWYSQAATGTGRQNLVALTNYAGTMPYGTQIGLEGGKPTVWVTSEATGLITAAAPVAAGWHHIAYTYDGAVHRLYGDGQLIGEVTRTSVSAVVTGAFLGGFDVLGLEVFNGTMDDVRITTTPSGRARSPALTGGSAP